ncbi:MAG: hypothetical protein IKS25_03290, partial [Oscillospiraceae bacterium]|nr:hypothetical protein [Oscillospiraceae bacterium]
EEALRTFSFLLSPYKKICHRGDAHIVLFFRYFVNTAARFPRFLPGDLMQISQKLPGRSVRPANKRGLFGHPIP